MYTTFYVYVFEILNETFNTLYSLRVWGGLYSRSYVGRIIKDPKLFVTE